MKKNEQFKLLNVILGMITSSVSLLSQQEWLNNKHYERPTFNFDYKKNFEIPRVAAAASFFIQFFPTPNLSLYEKETCVVRSSLGRCLSSYEEKLGHHFSNRKTQQRPFLKRFSDPWFRWKKGKYCPTLKFQPEKWFSLKGRMLHQRISGLLGSFCC